MQKIGFFGGCFNPPSIAHMEIAKRALSECELDRIVFVPMGNMYSKIELIDFKFRFEMLKLYCNNNPKIEVSDMQKNQTEKSYAIDTFKYINNNYKDSKNFYIMGIDNFMKMKKWKSYDELMNEYHYIVFKRDNITNIQINEKVKFIDFEFDISSSYIRNLIKTNKSVAGLLEKDVELYIKNNGLYR